MQCMAGWKNIKIGLLQYLEISLTLLWFSRWLDNQIRVKDQPDAANPFSFQTVELPRAVRNRVHPLVERCLEMVTIPLYSDR